MIIYSLMKHTRKTLKKNISNFFRNIREDKSSDNIWTTFKDYATKIHSNGFRYRETENKPELKKKLSFVPCTARATNDHSNRWILAYCVNRYMHPSLVDYFLQNGIVVDQDKYALSEMLQWIWRSRIRNGEKIKIYVPSDRMRMLLCDWLGIERIDNIRRVKLK